MYSLVLVDRLSCDLPYFSFVSHFAIKKTLEDCNFVLEKRLSVTVFDFYSRTRTIPICNI